ncbi:hypothetical protein J32TS2_23310 [Shouchella clausii]|jgi:hypothetical protein|uniref:Lipoprotein n=2 Tax=Shouchella TaxID=2893057 RepID=Q5WGL3_SHOC1|nr:hypothetical protein [Shouchella clausii]MCM3312733.1 hypothetical protein [Psychrobacillus sp. MER TA 17]PAE95379.1 hypothetical protein CHH70_04490 [Shouchella clausii]BAD64492.1 hypothetical protein ABC1957 [Shouchella clausii KSM-K16]GIN16975.1 hypothetical protein J32TS2_23310 [Shouchella clausii]
MKKSAWFLISTLLTLVACQSEETGILPKKALSESEERYLQIGTTYSFSFDLSNAGHQEIEELSFYSKRYQDGEPVEETLMSCSHCFLTKTHLSRLMKNLR